MQKPSEIMGLRRGRTDEAPAAASSPVSVVCWAHAALVESGRRGIESVLSL